MKRPTQALTEKCGIHTGGGGAGGGGAGCAGCPAKQLSVGWSYTVPAPHSVALPTVGDTSGTIANEARAVTAVIAKRRKMNTLQDIVDLATVPNFAKRTAAAAHGEGPNIWTLRRGKPMSPRHAAPATRR